MAIPELLLVHTPPVVVLDSVIVPPAQTVEGPVIDVDNEVTEMTFVARQPLPSLYVMVVVPSAIPVTTPDVKPIVATALLLLLHVPPDVESERVIVDPTQTVEGPEIGFALAVMVATVVAKHPVAATV